ncbi:MAG: polysaccharide deacetylase family protein [Catenulispora sp.]|nr:polysaccharide deacetylase family protein [Catenulispora sp.]
MTAMTTAASLLTHPFPATTTFGPVRNRILPGLAARGAPDHIALTFDDGPDPNSTPRFLDLLAARGVSATFFLLGSMAERAPGLVRELHAAGHEIAVHGWHHRSLLLRGPRATYQDLSRARDYLADLTGEQPQLFRPPYGVMTTAAHVSARRLGLRPTLWTSWGEDWTSRATPASVLKQVTKDLHGGGTILLHDTDCTAKPGSWHSTLGAVPMLLDHCAERGWKVGPLREHERVSSL